MRLTIAILLQIILYSAKAQIVPDIVEITLPKPASLNSVVDIPNPSLSVIPSGIYQPQQSVHQRNLAIIENDMKEYAERKDHQRRMMEEIDRQFSATITYTLGNHRKPGVERFQQAYEYIRSMLADQAPVDFLRAIYAVESAFDQSLTWDGFETMFNNSLRHIELLLENEGKVKNDNLTKIMTIYRYMSDTSKIYMPETEGEVITKPMLYDFEDYAGENDPSKIFVSKLLRTGSGQCMSLPMLFFLYSQAIGAEAHLAFAPQHSYIKFKDNFGNWNNIELTVRIFTTDDFLWQSNFLKAEQVRSGIYLRPLSHKETLAYMLTTLGLTYIKTFGVDDRALEISNTALKYFPNSLTGHMIQVGYYKALWSHVESQYQKSQKTQEQFQADKKAGYVWDQRIGSDDHIKKNLGWSKMPDAAYEAWLEGVNELANQRQHQVRKRELEQQIR